MYYASDKFNYNLPEVLRIMLHFDQKLLNYMAETCVQSGKKILSIYAEEHQNVSYKEDNSPVTEADLRSNDIIVSNLTKFDSTIQVLSEESDQSNEYFAEELFLDRRSARWYKGFFEQDR